MIKKLIISAVVLTALISGKEANAAGPGGFARSLALVPAINFQVAENLTTNSIAPKQEAAPALTFTQRRQLLRVNSSVNRAVHELNAYLDLFGEGVAVGTGSTDCLDCADLKRDQLVSLGWSADKLRIALSMTAQGRIQRVLVVDTAKGDIILGNHTAMVEMPSLAAPRFVRERQMSFSRAYYDL